MTSKIELFDQDGDKLEVFEVFGMGGPTLLIRVTQEDEESQMNLNTTQVADLVDFLQSWKNK